MYMEGLHHLQKATIFFCLMHLAVLSLATFHAWSLCRCRQLRRRWLAATHPDRTSELAVYSSSSSERSILLRITRKWFWFPVQTKPSSAPLVVAPSPLKCSSSPSTHLHKQQQGYSHHLQHVTSQFHCEQVPMKICCAWCFALADACQ